MPTVVPVADPADIRLDGYRDLRDRERASRTGRFVAESAAVLKQLVESAQHYPVESVLLTPARLDASTWLGRLPEQTPVYVASPGILENIAGFRVHRGCLALGMRGEPRRVEDVTGDQCGDQPRTAVVLDGVADPDNVGSIFRSGLALGADGVLLSETCADPLYRKAIRTSMGAVFRIPHARFASTANVVASLRRQGFCIAALTPEHTAETIADFAARTDARMRVALFLGNEGAGLGTEALQAADARVRIPMRHDVDSVNVHVAAAVALALLGRLVPPSAGDRSRRAAPHDTDPRTP